MSQLTVQLPDTLLDAARKLAERQHMSIQELIAKMLAESVRLDDAWEQLAAAGKEVSRERFLSILRKAPSVPPIPGDELPE